MQEVRRRRDVTLLGLRARLPLFFRAAAIVLGAGVVYFFAYTLVHTRRPHEFIMNPRAAQLSTNVVRKVENCCAYERSTGQSCTATVPRV